MNKGNEKKSFEQALKELEEIAFNLEGGELGLDDSIKEFERGIKLTRFCHKKLEDAERKIEILQKGKDGEIKAKSVEVSANAGEIDEKEDLQGSLL